MHWFSEFITIGPSHELIEVHHTEVESFNRVLALVTSVLAVAAIALAYLMYVSKTISPDAVVGPVRRLYEVVVRKYYFDDLYEDVLTRNLFYSKLAFSLDWLDTNLVDGIVRTADRAGRNVGRAMAQLQNGQLQGYGTIISAGVLVIFGIYLVFR
jgi:NADH-quinone oxidoreductase subunit L